MSEIILTEEAGTPSTPAADKWKVYLKSGGLYVLEDDGTEYGPLSVVSFDDLSDVDLTGVAQGCILYNDGTNWVVLAPGTSGYYLKTQGAGANPVWAAVAGGGDMTKAVYDTNDDGVVDEAFLAAEAGELSDADYGDVTSSYAVITINNNAVTLSKFVDATAQYKLLGRSSAGSGDFEEISGSANVFSFLQAANYAAMRTLLSLVPGTDVQAYDAELAALAGLVSAADKLPYFTGSGTASLADLTAFARSILDDADEATFKATVNLEIGTDVQAYDAELAALAGLTSAADKFPYFTGSGTAALLTIVSAIRTLLASADVPTFHDNLTSINAQTGTTYTTQDSDNGKIITLNNAAAITITVHQAAAAGFHCLIIQKGAGQVTVAAGGTGNVRNYDSHTKLAGQYAMGSIFVESNAGTAPEVYLSGNTGT